MHPFISFVHRIISTGTSMPQQPVRNVYGGNTNGLPMAQKPATVPDQLMFPAARSSALLQTPTAHLLPIQLVPQMSLYRTPGQPMHWENDNPDAPPVSIPIPEGYSAPRGAADVPMLRANRTNFMSASPAYINEKLRNMHQAYMRII